MKSRLITALLIGGMVLGPAAAFAAPYETDAETAAHEGVLDLAGAFTNDGFKLRDGDYVGTLKTGESKLVEVNLYAGNQYWFSVATSDTSTDVSISLYDEKGKLVQTDPYADPHRSAAGFSPDASGPYFVRLANAGAPATYCLIYSYK